jgi:Terminase small subunit.
MSASKQGDKPKRPPKTPKEKRFVKEYLANGGNGMQAVLKVYDVKDLNSASTIAAENLRKLTITDHMEKIEGLRPQDLLLVLLEGLSAKKQVGAISGRGAGEGTVDFVDVEDYAVRHKYLETALKLGGHLRQQDGGNSVNFLQFIQNQKNDYN